jgi:hypothetical protein
LRVRVRIPSERAVRRGMEVLGVRCQAEGGAVRRRPARGGWQEENAEIWRIRP